MLLPVFPLLAASATLLAGTCLAKGVPLPDCEPEYSGEFRRALDSSGFKVDDESEFFAEVRPDGYGIDSQPGRSLSGNSELRTHDQNELWSPPGAERTWQDNQQCDNLKLSRTGEPINSTLHAILMSSVLPPAPVLQVAGSSGGIVGLTPTLRSVIAEGEDMQSFWPLLDVPGSAPTGVYAGYGMRKGIEARDGHMSGSKGSCSFDGPPTKPVMGGTGTHWGLGAAQLGASAYLQVDPPRSWIYEPDSGDYNMSDPSFAAAPKLSYELFFTRYNGPLSNFRMMCGTVNLSRWNDARDPNPGSRGDSFVGLEYASPNCLKQSMALNISDVYPSPSATPSISPSPSPSPAQDSSPGPTATQSPQRHRRSYEAAARPAPTGRETMPPGATWKTYGCEAMACAFKLTTQRQHYMYYGQHPQLHVPQIYLDGELGVGWSWQACQHCRCNGPLQTAASSHCGQCQVPTRMFVTPEELLGHNRSFTIGSSQPASAFGTISHVAIVSNDKRRRLAPQFSRALPPIEGGVWEFVNTTTAGYFSGRVGVVARCEHNGHVLVGAPIARNWMAGWSGPAWHGTAELQAERNLVADLRRRARARGQSALPRRHFFNPSYLLDGDQNVARDSNVTEPNQNIGDLPTGDEYADSFPAPWAHPRCIDPWSKDSPYRRDFHKHGIKEWSQLHEEVVRVSLSLEVDPAEYPRGSSNAEALADAIEAELLDVLLQAEDTRIQVLLEQDTELKTRTPPGMRVLVVIWPSNRRAPPSGTYGQDDDHIVGAVEAPRSAMDDLAPWATEASWRYASRDQLGNPDYATALNSPRMMGYQLMDLFANPADSIAGDNLRYMMRYPEDSQRPELEFLLLCRNHQYAQVCSVTWLFELFFAGLAGQFAAVVILVSGGLLCSTGTSSERHSDDLDILPPSTKSSSSSDGQVHKTGAQAGATGTGATTLTAQAWVGNGSGKQATTTSHPASLSMHGQMTQSMDDPAVEGPVGGASRTLPPSAHYSADVKPSRSTRRTSRLETPYGDDHDGQELPASMTPSYPQSFPKVSPSVQQRSLESDVRGSSEQSLQGGMAFSVNGGGSLQGGDGETGGYLPSVRSEGSSSAMTASTATLAPRFMSHGMQPYLVIVPSASLLAVGSVYVYALKALLEQQQAGTLTLWIGLGLFVILNTWQAWYRTILLRQGGVSSDPVLEAWLSRHWSHRLFFFACQTVSCLLGSNFAMLLQARLPCCTCSAMPLKAMMRRPEAFPDLLRSQALVPHLLLLVPTMGFLVVRLAGVTPKPNAEWPAGVVLAICFLYLLLVSVGALVAGLELDVLAEDPNSSQSAELRRGLMAGDSESRGRPGSVLTLRRNPGGPGMSQDTRFSVDPGSDLGRGSARGSRSRYGAPSVSGTVSSGGQQPSLRGSAGREFSGTSAEEDTDGGGGGDFLPTAATIDDRFRQTHAPGGFGLPGGRTHAELAGTLANPTRPAGTAPMEVQVESKTNLRSSLEHGSIDDPDEMPVGSGSSAMPGSHIRHTDGSSGPGWLDGSGAEQEGGRGQSPSLSDSGSGGDRAGAGVGQTGVGRLRGAAFGRGGGFEDRQGDGGDGVPPRAPAIASMDDSDEEDAVDEAETALEFRDGEQP